MGKEKKLIIKESAYKELENELEFIAKNYSKDYAIKFAFEFIQQIELLTTEYLTFPENRYLPTKNKLYRNIIWKKNYWIIYKIKPTSIEILSLFHTKRNPKVVRKFKKR